MELDEREKELLKRLRVASKKNSVFTLTLKIDDEILTTREFSASQFSKESVVATRTHFMMNDIIRIITKTFSETEEEMSEEKKKEEMNKLWNKKEKNDDK